MNAYTFLDTPVTPQGKTEFGPPEAAVRLAAASSVVVPLTDFGLIRASGEEAVAFLHNLVSNDVKKLAEDGAHWNSLNSPKGRMIASLLVWREADELIIALAADLHQAVLKKLSMYVLRSKVKLSDASGEIALFGLAGEEVPHALAAAGLSDAAAPMHTAASDCGRVIRLSKALRVAAVPAEAAGKVWSALAQAGLAPAGSSAWSWLMIRDGLPLVTQATQEEFVAQMLNFELIGGVSFNKGCYPGQEIVARTQYLGKLKKRMYRLHFAEDASVDVGKDIFAPEFGDQSIGKVLLSSPSPTGGSEALAVLQSSSAEAGELHLGAPDGASAAVLPLPYSLD